MDTINTLLNELSQQPEMAAVLSQLAERPAVRELLDQFLVVHGNLSDVMPDLLRTYDVLARRFAARSTLFLCGNGGSFADALHISGELLKSFERRRGLSAEHKEAFRQWPEGRELADHLEQGFPVRVLGLDGSLASAVQNDNPMRDIHYAQELYACARPGDVLMGISTSGNATNVCYAIVTAKALGLQTIGLTGQDGGRLSSLVDIAIRAPGNTTKSIQESHLAIYHTLCAMVEAHFFARSQ